MLILHDPGLDAKTARGLNRYQAKVDSEGTYAERVERGKTLFESYNRSWLEDGSDETLGRGRL